MELIDFKLTVQQEYLEALDRIKNITGLELKLSEKVMLRKIVCESYERNNLTKRPENSFNPSPEAVHIFLERYYDLSVPDQGSLSSFLLLKRKVNEEKGYDAIFDFFKLKQDRAYLL